MSTYSFPPDLAAMIHQQMSRGAYPSEDDVLRDALQALTQRNADSEAIRVGIGDMEAGRVRPLADVAADIRKSHAWAD